MIHVVIHPTRKEIWSPRVTEKSNSYYHTNSVSTNKKDRITLIKVVLITTTLSINLFSSSIFIHQIQNFHKLNGHWRKIMIIRNNKF